MNHHPKYAKFVALAALHHSTAKQILVAAHNTGALAAEKAETFVQALGHGNRDVRKLARHFLAKINVVFLAEFKLKPTGSVNRINFETYVEFSAAIEGFFGTTPTTASVPDTGGEVDQHPETHMDHLDGSGTGKIDDIGTEIHLNVKPETGTETEIHVDTEPTVTVKLDGASSGEQPMKKAPAKRKATPVANTKGTEIEKKPRARRTAARVSSTAEATPGG